MSDGKTNLPDGSGEPIGQSYSNPATSAIRDDQQEVVRAPWEIGAQKPEPPRAPEGTRYAAYQNAPSANSPLAPYPGLAGAPPLEAFEVTEAPSNWRNLGMVAAAIIVALLGALLVYEFVPSNVATPTEFITYQSPDGRFTCQAPINWSRISTAVDSTSDNAVGGALFKSGPAKIDITTDTVADLKAAVLLNSGSSMPEEFNQDPATVLHDMDRSRTQGTMKNYVEMPSQPMQTGYGIAQVSEFTGKGGFLGLGGPMHGYRASISDGAYTIEAVLQCPEKSWSRLSPSFQQVIKSFGHAEDGVFSSIGASGGANMVPGMSGPVAPPAATPAAPASQSILPASSGSDNDDNQ